MPTINQPVGNSLPANEHDRLTALRWHGILDTPSDPKFDRIVALVQNICQTPIALVSFVDDDRQWFKARCGVEIDQSALDTSVCALAIRQHGIFQIEDLSTDPRTSAMSLVTGEAHLRFYAGAPLVTRDGFALGSLCAIDTAPRNDGLTKAQSEALLLLAEQVVELIENDDAVRKRDHALALDQFTRRSQETEDRYRAIVDSAIDSAIMAMDANGIVTSWSAGAEHIFGWSAAEMCGNPADRFFTPEDCAAAVPDREFRIARREGRASDERWHLRKDGSRFYAHGAMTPLVGTDSPGFVKAVRDITVEHETKIALEAARRTAEIVTTAARLGTFDYDLKLHTLTWDDGCRALFGLPPGAPVSYEDSFLSGVHPDDRTSADASVQAALDPGGAGMFETEYRTIGIEDEKLRYLSARGQAFFEDGKPVRLLGTVHDVTDARLAEARLHETDQRLRLANRATNDAIWDWDLVRNHVTWNEAIERAYGHSLSDVEPTGDWWIRHIHVDDRDRIEHSIHAVIDCGATDWTDKYRFRRADGSYAFIVDRGFVIRGNDGKAERMIGAMLDVTVHRANEVRSTAIAELSDRLLKATTSAEAVAVAAQIVGKTLGTSRAGYSHIDLETDLFEVEADWTDEGVASLKGSYSLDLFRNTIERVQTGNTLAVTDVDTAQWLGTDAAGYQQIGTKAQIKVPLLAGGELIGLLYVHQSEPRRWTDEELAFAQAVADRTHAELAKMKAEADQLVLNQELSHRLKNTLAVVLSIATQTLRTVPDRAPVEAFEKRIHALSSAHDVLLQESWASAPIGEVVRTVLSATGHGDRVIVAGPVIDIGPRATLSLSLLLHELTTNALKYGALSVPEGHVNLDWHVEINDGVKELAMIWKEQGGPPATAPAPGERKGFGSRLIQMGLVGTGGVDKSYTDEGLNVIMRATFAQLQLS